MKKLLFLVLLLFSCEKKDVCKSCITTVTQSGGGMASGKVLSTSSFKACGDELKVDGQVITATSGGYTVVSRTTCK
jgi:hypothetical protein